MRSSRRTASTSPPARVYELADPNLGNYSPTQVVHAATAKDTIQALSMRLRRPPHRAHRRPGDRGRPCPATDAASRSASAGSRSRPRARASPSWSCPCSTATAGASCRARSSAVPRQPDVARRRFSGDLRLELRQVFGPFWQSDCRIEDAADVERLRLAEAVGAGAGSDRAPGDGINLVRSSEALDRVTTGGGIVAIRGSARRRQVRRSTRSQPRAGRASITRCCGCRA